MGVEAQEGPWRARRGFPAALPLCVTCTVLGLAAAGCELQGPEGRGVEVVTATTGDDPDPDGYTWALDAAGGRSGRVGPNARVTVPDIPAGRYTVELGDVAENCSVRDGPSRSVTVPWEGRADFPVACVARRGDLSVSIGTSGEDPDPDGYEVLVDGEDPRSAPPDGSVRFTDLPAGPHDVELRDVAANCTVQGAHPRRVEVSFGAETAVEIEVLCRSRTGEVEVRTSTSGEDPDPDGYAVSVAGETRSAPPTGVVTFRSIPSGERRVTLSGMASNCAVEGANPRDVTVPFGGGTVTTTFRVECVSRLGDLRVEAETGGLNPDTDGYDVRVDGGAPRALGPNGSVTFEDLPSGDHEVELSGVAVNCAVEGENPRRVEVPLGGGTVTTTFSVECVPGGGGGG